MKRLLFFLFCCTMLLTSCGLFRKTTREKSVTSFNLKSDQSLVDTSITTERTIIDTTIVISESAEDIIRIPVDYSEDAIPVLIENDRYSAKFQYYPKQSVMTASITTKAISVPVKMVKEKKERKNIIQTQNIEATGSQKNKQVERTPSMNWDLVIPLCLGLCGLFIIVFFLIKTKNL